MYLILFIRKITLVLSPLFRGIEVQYNCILFRSQEIIFNGSAAILLLLASFGIIATISTKDWQFYFELFHIDRFYMAAGVRIVVILTKLNLIIYSNISWAYYSLRLSRYWTEFHISSAQFWLGQAKDQEMVHQITFHLIDVISLFFNQSPEI